MSELIGHIHYRSGFEIGKPDGLSRSSGEAKSRMDIYFFVEGELLDLENDDVGEEEDAEHMELAGIDVATWEKKNALWVVSQEHRLQVLRQQNHSQVA